jgi:hypothetical protein
MNGLFDWVTAHGVGGSALVAAAVAFVIFLLTRIVEIIAHAVNVRNTRRRLIIGLFREVKANVTTIEDFLDRQPHPIEMRNKVIADRNLRPLMIVDETSQFYDSITSALPDIKSDCLLALSEFYAAIRKVNAIKDAFESNAFPTISDDGRGSTADDLWKGCRVAEKAGWKALYEMELAYPREWFTAFKSLR